MNADVDDVIEEIRHAFFVACRIEWSDD